MHVLIVLHGMPPTPGRTAVGAGIRAWCNGEGLRARGHRVQYLTRAEDLPGADAPISLELPALAGEADGGSPEPPGGIGPVAEGGGDSPRVRPGFAPPGGPLGSPGNPFSFASREDLVRVVRQASPDVVLVEQFEEARKLHGLGIPVALDLFAPRLLEAQFQGPQADQEVVRTLDALNHADFFVFSNERQKVFYLALLALAGVDCTRPPVGVVPVSCPPIFPEPRKPRSPVFVSGGVFWPWADLTPGLRVLQDQLERRRNGRVEVFGGGYAIRSEATRYADPRDALPPSRRVRHRGLVPFDQLLDEYARASVAFDVMARNPEREMNLSFRQIDYLRCGLPLVTARFQEIAPLVERYGAGWVVDPEDEDGIRAVIDTVLDDPDAIARASAAAQRLAREHFTWDRTLDALAAFVESPRVREKRPTVLAAMSKVTTELWAEHEEIPRLKEALADQVRVNQKKTEEVLDLNRQVWKLIDSVDRMSLSVGEVTRFKSVAIQYLGEQEDRALRDAEEIGRELERARFDLQKKEDEIRAAQDGVEKLKASHSATLGDLERAREQVFARDRTVAELRAQRERVLHQLTEARAEARDLAGDLAKKAQELAGAEDRLALVAGRAEAQIVEQEGRFLARLDAAEHRARGVVEELRTRLDDALIERDQVRQRIAEQDAALAGLRSDLQKKSKEIEDLEDLRRGELARAAGALTEAQALFASRLDAAEVEARTVLETLRHEAQALRSERDGLRVKVEGFERAIQELKGELNRRAGELRAERQERRAEQREHEATRSRMEADFHARLERAEGEARNVLEGLADQLGRVRSERDGLRRRLERAESQLPELKRDLRKKSAEIEELSKELERQRRDAAEGLVRAEGHFAGVLATAEAHAETVFAELRERLQAATDDAKAARDQLARTEEVVQELKRETQKRYAEARELRQRIKEERRLLEVRFAEQQRDDATAAEAAADAARAELDAARDEAARFRVERDNLSDRIARHEADLPVLRRDLDKKSAEIRALAAALKGERAERERVAAELAHDALARVDEAEAEARAKLAELLEEAARLRGERDRLAARLERHGVEVPALRQDLAKKAAELRELTATLKREKAERDRVVGEAERRMVERLEDAEEAARAAVAGSLQGLAVVTAERDTARADVARLTMVLKGLRADVDKKSVELAAEAGRQRRLVAEYEARIRTLLAEAEASAAAKAPPAAVGSGGRGEGEEVSPESAPPGSPPGSPPR